MGLTKGKRTRVEDVDSSSKKYYSPSKIRATEGHDNIAEKIKEVDLKCGRLYKHVSTGGLYVLNAFTQDFIEDNIWLVVFTNPLNNKIYSIIVDEFIINFKLVEVEPKGK